MTGDREHAVDGFVFTLTNGVVSVAKDDGTPVALDRESENLVRSGFGLPAAGPRRLEDLSLEVQERFNLCLDIMTGVKPNVSVQDRRRARFYVSSTRKLLRGETNP